MTPEDFPQFPDPRVREVMAAAANLVETVAMHINVSDGIHDATDLLKTALFAAQHSKPRDVSPGCQCQWEAGDSACEVHGSGDDDAMPSTHEKPIKLDKWGYGMAETNQFLVDGSKPGGKAFIAAVESKPKSQEVHVACPFCAGLDHVGECK